MKTGAVAILFIILVYTCRMTAHQSIKISAPILRNPGILTFLVCEWYVRPWDLSYPPPPPPFIHAREFVWHLQFSVGPRFSPSTVHVAVILPARGWRECLSPEHSGMKALGGMVSTVRTRGSLLCPSWTVPPGHCPLLFSFKTSATRSTDSHTAARQRDNFREPERTRQTKMLLRVTVFSWHLYVKKNTFFFFFLYVCINARFNVWTRRKHVGGK